MIAQKLISFKSIRRVFFLRQTSTIRDYRNFLSTVREEKKCERMYDRTRIHDAKQQEKKKRKSRSCISLRRWECASIFFLEEKNFLILPK